MSENGETLAEKQRRLAADIARQRGQLAAAYRDLAKPILYTEYGLRGFGFLRQNPWILTIVPAAFSTTTSVLALVRTLTAKPAPKKLKWFGREAARETEREARRVKKTLTDHAMTWGGRGWKLFKLYKRVRKYFP
jgi:hypothetical protein